MITNFKKHWIIMIIVVGIMIVLLLAYVLYEAFFSQWGERGWSKIAILRLQKRRDCKKSAN